MVGRKRQLTRIGASVRIADWPAFPHIVDAIKRLNKHYKLIAISNIDHQSFTSTLRGPLKDVYFDATHIAKDMGSYKPSQQNFKYLIELAKKELESRRRRFLW